MVRDGGGVGTQQQTAFPGRAHKNDRMVLHTTAYLDAVPLLR